MRRDKNIVKIKLPENKFLHAFCKLFLCTLIHEFEFRFAGAFNGKIMFFSCSFTCSQKDWNYLKANQNNSIEKNMLLIENSVLSTTHKITGKIATFRMLYIQKMCLWERWKNRKKKKYWKNFSNFAFFYHHVFILLLNSVEKKNLLCGGGSELKSAKRTNKTILMTFQIWPPTFCLAHL